MCLTHANYRSRAADTVVAGVRTWVPSGGRATVKQLINHTTGLGYWFWNSDLVRWESATGTPNVLSGSNVIFTAPMMADPGIRTPYSFGRSITFGICRTNERFIFRVRATAFRLCRA
jgi:hypothetical protein